MDKLEFRNNLIQTLHEEYDDFQDIKFIVIPDIEKNKKYNSKDDFMRLTIFNDDNLRERLFDIEKVVKLFSGLAPLFPIWIEVRFREKGVVELKTSLRFRKPSELKYKETGHPPFVICK